MRALRNKLRARRGMTVIETLAAALVLILLGLMLHTGLLLARQSYDDMTSEAETQLLLSTLTDALSGELRYARGVVTEVNTGRLASYTSASYGEGASLGLDPVEGRLQVNGGPLLPAGVYGHGDYRLDACEIIYDAEAGVFRVRLEVSDRQDRTKETEFSIRCLNASGGGMQEEGEGA